MTEVFFFRRYAVIPSGRVTEKRVCLGWLMSGVLLLAACNPQQESPPDDAQTQDSQPVAMGRPGSTYVYACNDKSRFTARIEGETAWLFLATGTISLPHVPAASGAKYSDGATTFWSKGEEASLERADQPRVQCENDRAEAIWEDAKLRGADFRGRGNEPGWHIEISNSYGIVFVTSYGSERYHFKTFEMTGDDAARKTIYEARHDGRKLTVVLEGGRCSDSMSDEQFETTVTVTFDGKQLAGCGRSLH